MAKIVWSKQAAEHLEAVHDYLAQRSPAAAKSVIRGILAKIDLLRKQTRLGHVSEEARNGEVRVLLYGQYRIAYEVKREDRVEILGISHAAIDRFPR